MNIKLFFFCLLLISPSISKAATGFSVHGICYPDSATASQAVYSDYPVTTGNQLIEATSVTFSGSTFNTAIRTTDLTTNAIYSFSHALYFPVCDPATQVSPVINAQNVLETFGWAFAAVMLFFTLGMTIGIAKSMIFKA